MNIKFVNKPAGIQFISVIERIADEGVNEGVNEEIKQNEGINEGVNEGIKQNEGINELESSILAILEKTPGQRVNSIAKKIKRSIATTERYISELKAKGLIEFRGIPKTGGYYKK